VNYVPLEQSLDELETKRTLKSRELWLQVGLGADRRQVVTRCPGIACWIRHQMRCALERSSPYSITGGTMPRRSLRKGTLVRHPGAVPLRLAFDQTGLTAQLRTALRKGKQSQQVSHAGWT
jgi:hypothetical protein